MPSHTDMMVGDLEGRCRRIYALNVCRMYNISTRSFSQALINSITVSSVIHLPRCTKSYSTSREDRSRGISRWHAVMQCISSQIMCLTKCSIP